MRLCSLICCLVFLILSGCATVATPPPEPVGPSSEEIRILKLEDKARRLVATSNELHQLQGKHDEVRRRLTTICVDHPKHLVCQPQTAADFARKAFCADPEFTAHVDGVVRACHQGQCKQLDEAQMLKRTDYMTLLTRLPHSLVTFGSSRTKLDKRDREQIQNFIEQIRADGGYVIIVGRASKDGPWRKNLRLALERAESTRKFVVDNMGFDADKVGFITYGHEKMYLTELDAERLTARKMTMRQANRSALLFAYPCWDESKRVGVR
ncbi:MAG: outer membrane protein OmpA-like peptidoglycan-associated protein [Myxococcota bacterium]|jgi:outer membrane protein OmpA-like peptidoglycan-associated protein